MVSQKIGAHALSEINNLIYGRQLFRSRAASNLKFIFYYVFSLICAQRVLSYCMSEKSFYIVTHYIEMDKTSRTYGTMNPPSSRQQSTRQTISQVELVY